MSIHRLLHLDCSFHHQPCWANKVYFPQPKNTLLTPTRMKIHFDEVLTLSTIDYVDWEQPSDRTTE